MPVRGGADDGHDSSPRFRRREARWRVAAGPANRSTFTGGAVLQLSPCGRVGT